MLACDWCEQEIRSSKQTGYSIEAIPFRPLNIAGKRKTEDGPVIVAELHFHERCRESFFREAVVLLKDHEPTDDELEFDHSAVQEERPEQSAVIDPDERRSQEWHQLPKHELDRLVLEALGEDRLTNTEIGTRLQEGDGPCPYLPNEHVAVITLRLFKAGELERQKGQFGASRVRYCRPKPSAELRKLGEQLTGGEES